MINMLDSAIERLLMISTLLEYPVDEVLCGQKFVDRMFFDKSKIT
jgi:hypothetical protein